MILLAAAASSLGSLVIPLAVVVLGAGLLLATLSIVKRRLKGDSGTANDFSLTELRDLHRAGKLTDAEFERAKSLLVGKVHSQLAKEAKPPTLTPAAPTEFKGDEND